MKKKKKSWQYSAPPNGIMLRDKAAISKSHSRASCTLTQRLPARSFSFVIKLVPGVGMESGCEWFSFFSTDR